MALVSDPSGVSSPDESSGEPKTDEVAAPPAGMQGGPGPLLRLIKDQRIAFLLVGTTNTVVGLGWFVLFQALLQQYVGYLVILLFAHVAAVLCAFVLYRRFVFRVRGHVLRDLGRFELVNLTTLGINAVLLTVLVSVAGFPVLASQVAITAFTVLISFFGHRDFSFRRTPDAHQSQFRPGPGSAA